MIGYLSSTASIVILACLVHTAATTTDASSPKVVAIPFDKRSKADNTLNGLLRRQQEKAHAVELRDVKDIFYYVNITLGTPPQELAVSLDTGSSDLWVLSDQAASCKEDPGYYCPLGFFEPGKSSSFSQVFENGFNNTYALGNSNSGDIVNDTIAVGDLTLEQFSFGLVHNPSSRDYHGIFGIGYVALEGTIQSANYTYPNFPQALYDKGLIESRSYSLFLNDLNASTGTILFGGVDTSKYLPPLTAIPIRNDVWSGQLDSFDVPLTGVSFRTDSNADPSPLTIPSTNIPVTLDSGATDVILPNDLAAELFYGIGAITYDSDQQILLLPCSYADSPASIDFQFAGPSGPMINVPIHEFILPLVDDEGEPLRADYTGVEICRLGVRFSQGGYCILGDVFLRSAYVVYDIENNEIAIAQAKYGDPNSNIQVITRKSSPGSSSNGGQGGIPDLSSTASEFPATETVTGYVAIQTDREIRLDYALLATASDFATPTFNLGLAEGATATISGSGGRATGTSSSGSSGQGSENGAMAIGYGDGKSARSVVLATLLGFLAIGMAL